MQVFAAGRKQEYQRGLERHFAVEKKQFLLLHLFSVITIVVACCLQPVARDHLSFRSITFVFKNKSALLMAVLDHSNSLKAVEQDAQVTQAKESERQILSLHAKKTPT